MRKQCDKDSNPENGRHVYNVLPAMVYPTHTTFFLLAACLVFFEH